MSQIFAIYICWIQINSFVLQTDIVCMGQDHNAALQHNFTVKAQPTKNNFAYIFVIDTFHKHQLAVRPFGVRLVLERSAQLLDGHISVEYSVISRAVGKVRTSKTIAFSLTFNVNGMFFLKKLECFSAKTGSGH